MPPLKRHPALQPYSREHHTSLFLARLLRNDAPAYRDLPTDAEGKRMHALQVYEAHLVPHFQREDQHLLPHLGNLPSLVPHAERLLTEHNDIRQHFAQLPTQSPAELSAALDQLGRALEAHIRYEERELFPLLEGVGLEGWL